MSQRPVTRPRRGAKPPSRVATALFVVGLLVVGSAITAVLYVPTSLEDWALMTGIVMVFEATGWAIHALWRRMTRKRRRERLMG